MNIPLKLALVTTGLAVAASLAVAAQTTAGANTGTQTSGRLDGTASIAAPGVAGHPNAPAGPARIGADMPWTKYEAEKAETSGTVKSGRRPGEVETEASGRSLVELSANGQSITFTSNRSANRLTIRYNIPEKAQGDIELSVNKGQRQTARLSSARTWLQESRKPGGHFRFFDEVTVPVNVASGDEISLVKRDDGLAYCKIDFIELETAPAAVAKPDKTWLDITDYGAVGTDTIDDLPAIVACLKAAAARGKKVWIPAGDFYINDEVAVPDGVTISGAGIWHATIKKNIPSAKNVKGLNLGLNCSVSHLKVEDVLGSERENGRIGVFLNSGCDVNDVWVANTFGAGIMGKNIHDVTIRNCRVRGSFADAIHIARSSYNCLAENNTVRNSGDDGLAIVPYASEGCRNIVYRYNTVENNYWGRGLTLLGGDRNVLEYNRTVDSPVSGIMVGVETYRGVSTKYCTNFKVQYNDIVRAGDPQSNAHAALWILDAVPGAPMTGMARSNRITDYVGNGITVSGHVGGEVAVRDNEVDDPAAPQWKRIFLAALAPGFTPKIEEPPTQP